MRSEVQRYITGIMTPVEMANPGPASISARQTVVVTYEDYAALEAECEVQRNTAAGAHKQLTASRLETEHLAKDWMAAVAERDALRAELAGVKQASLELAGSIGRRHDVVTQLRAELAELQERASEEWQAVKHDLDVAREELAEVKGREAVCEVSEETFCSDGTSDIITCCLPIGTKLYVSQPAATSEAHGHTSEAAPGVVGLVKALELWLAGYDEVAANPDFEPHPHVAERVTKSRAALSTWRQAQASQQKGKA